MAFTLGVLAESRQQCGSNPDTASESHAQHVGVPASNQQNAVGYQCLSLCCSLVSAAWTPRRPIISVDTGVEVLHGILGLSQHVSSPQRFLLPPALAPPLID